METTNLISTPNVEGNIGSCTSQKINVVTERFGLFTEMNQSVVTNSCTGEVQNYNHWGFTGFAGFIFTCIAILVVFLILFFATD